jgi:hypothetical protein
MPRVDWRPPWTARTRAKNDLENYCLVLTTTVQWKKVREKLYGGDEHGIVLNAVKELSRWIGENQDAEQVEFEAKHVSIRRVVNQQMNDTRNKEYDEEQKEEEKKKKEEEERKSKGKGKGTGQWKPPQPAGPPPAHLLSGRSGPYVR